MHAGTTCRTRSLHATMHNAFNTALWWCSTISPPYRTRTCDLAQSLAPSAPDVATAAVTLP
jgi:hypothetical protein